ncbi:hypothetical protein [Mesorhizobium sp. BR1-1-16]|uniref:hypothetical protein n=1 Tax=Mesorhizobium sp. BR1-1-16 TaxID=2876653 RepID=UPI0025703CB8|nr:hypothetical protein [Mesorhizobium sp. BR1-1-16]
MFGGLGAFSNGLMFAIVIADVIYLNPTRRPGPTSRLKDASPSPIRARMGARCR